MTKNNQELRSAEAQAMLDMQVDSSFTFGEINNYQNLAEDYENIGYSPQQAAEAADHVRLYDEGILH